MCVYLGYQYLYLGVLGHVFWYRYVLSILVTVQCSGEGVVWGAPDHGGVCWRGNREETRFAGTSRLIRNKVIPSKIPLNFKLGR